MRAMFVMEDDDRLWLARATPRAWLEQGRKIVVKNAPTHSGTAAHEIILMSRHGIGAAIQLQPAWES